MQDIPRILINIAPSRNAVVLKETILFMYNTLHKDLEIFFQKHGRIFDPSEETHKLEYSEIHHLVRPDASKCKTLLHLPVRGNDR